MKGSLNRGGGAGGAYIKWNGPLNGKNTSNDIHELIRRWLVETFFDFLLIFIRIPHKIKNTIPKYQSVFKHIQAIEPRQPKYFFNLKCLVTPLAVFCKTNLHTHKY